MGIKDNFSQAVRELWKKDSEQPAAPAAETKPSELDKYLREEPPAEESAAAQTAAEAKPQNGSVPLETPYYRTEKPAAPAPDAQNAAAEEPKPEVRPAPAPQPKPVNEIDPITGSSAPYIPQKPIDNSDAGRGYGANDAGRGYGARDYGQNDGGRPQQGGYRPEYGRDREPGRDYGGYNDGYDRGYTSPANYSRGGDYGDRYGGGGYNPPSGGPMQAQNETDETTVISKNTVIDGNVRSLANMQIDGNIKGNVETTRNIDMSGKIIGDITCNNAGMNSAAMQGNVSLKGRIRMDRDTILIGDLSSQYADINGRVRGKLDIVGKAELKRDAIVFGDINASTIAVTDGAIIQGYVNTTFLSKEDSRNVFPEAISLDSKEGQVKG